MAKAPRQGIGDWAFVYVEAINFQMGCGFPDHGIDNNRGDGRPFRDKGTGFFAYLDHSSGGISSIAFGQVQYWWDRNHDKP